MDWIKIMCNLLDHRKIKMVRKGPEGNTLFLLWLLMLTEAGKCNRGGYLMLSDNLAYTSDTLSMVTGIPLPIVQLGLSIFVELDMIDQQDGVLFIKNWRKYQSEDKLEARRAKDRLRQERHRENERNKILALPPSDVSRNHHVRLSRDVTPENRQEQNREEQSRKEQTTDAVRLFLQDTPLFRISDHDLQDLQQRHGNERLMQAADIAAETWHSKREDSRNPGGYLQALCASLVVPEWYGTFCRTTGASQGLAPAERGHCFAAQGNQGPGRGRKCRARCSMERACRGRAGALRSLALADLPVDVNAAAGVVQILAKMKAWEARQVSDCS